jgi:membrane fusion protein (multidrug efflux system)
MSLRRKFGASLASMGLLMVSTAAGCGRGNTYVAPPPPDVTVARPTVRTVTEYLEYTGTTRPILRVELRARVKGFLKQKLFKAGADVKEGELLFVIDEEPFRVRLDQARAKLAEAEATLKKAQESKARQIAQAQLEVDQSQLTLAKLDESRNRTLFGRNAGSREEFDKAEANRKKFEAQVEADVASLEQSKADYEINILAARSSLKAASAEVRNAEIDLGYCRVTAPFDGRITLNEVDVGNYVGDGEATVLATIVKLDPIYAYVNLSENDLLRLQRLEKASGSGQGSAAPDSPIPMEIGLGDEEGFPHKGKTEYTDPSVDPGTGTVRARGIFANPGGAITPGLFVRVRLPIVERSGALLVPGRAIGADQAGSYLLVVGKDNLVERRQVKEGSEVDGLRVVDGKLKPSDLVVIDGLQRARPGLKVNPKVASDPVASLAAASSPAPVPAPSGDAKTD